MEGDQLLAAWRRHVRRSGARFVAAGVVMVLIGIPLAPRDLGLGGIVAGSVLAMVGVWRIARLPIFLRRPERIASVDPFAPGERHLMQIVLDDGRPIKAAPPDGSRHDLQLALVQASGAARLRARVVRR